MSLSYTKFRNYLSFHQNLLLKDLDSDIIPGNPHHRWYYTDHKFY